MYDIAIIGAGINGCSVAYEFTSIGKKVIIFDMESIASGGSGAAGAFISPKFSKSGELKELIGDAFLYSMDYYEKYFREHLTKAQLLHVAKNDTDAEILKIYREKTDLELKEIDVEVDNEYLSIDAGIVDAKATCKAMSRDAKFVKQEVKSIKYDNDIWLIDSTCRAKHLVIATGAYEQLIKEPYINLRGVWGHRIDIKTTTSNRYSLHQEVSISPSIDGVVAIGATHNVHYHPQTTKVPYNIEDGRAELLKKASRTIELKDIEIIKDYTGLRSGSFDYMPLIGSIVDSKKSIESLGNKLRVKKMDYTHFEYHKNLYMINGNGGYGFVLAPYLAKKLKEHIVDGGDIKESISPARFFHRWVKRN